MTLIPTRASVLTDEMLARFDERAPHYDRENTFFTEDFEELRAAGYLLATVPTGQGGMGLGLDDYVKLQSQLAYVAPATALAVNMHCYWTGVASDLARVGDASLQVVLDKRPRAKCSPRCTARQATTSRCCCRARAPNGPTAAG